MNRALSLGIFNTAYSPQNYNHTNISYDNTTDDYHLSCCGSSSTHTDEIFFVGKKLSGTFIIYTGILFPSHDRSAHGKAGLIIRKHPDAGSPFVRTFIEEDDSVTMQYREKQNSDIREIKTDSSSITFLQLEKQDNQVIIKISGNGFPLKEQASVVFDDDMNEALAGIFMCPSGGSVNSKVIFFNTRITIPAKAGFIPYTDFLGSRIEVLDIGRGRRKILFETNNNLEAPNWSPDGKYLILNGRGKLYRYDFKDNILTMLNSGFATANNNDHGFSPDGKLLAISHHATERPAGQNSVIYTIPSGGGDPVQITSGSPSYWHGWSPDGRYLIYTAQRNERWNIYRIPASGGEEQALTDNAFLNDGSQYSANGEFIWFNSNRSGTMQIWKMRKNSSEQEQITNDLYQNWFPHESPDGKHIVFLSYLQDVDPWDHPYYKHVMIRCMNPDGSDIKVIAHVYGGQGTINVPSWSPDSKKIAFVSNTDTMPV